MDNETRQRYISGMLGQREIAEGKREERLDKRKEAAQELSTSPTDRVEQVASKMREPIRLAYSVLACQNTIGVLKSMPTEPTDKIQHGAEFTFTDVGKEGDISKEARYIFIDPAKIPLLRVVNGSHRALAMIPNGPVFILGDSPVGKNIMSMGAGEQRTYTDLEGKVRTIKITGIR